MSMQQQNPDAVEIELDDKPSKIVPMPQPKPQAPQAPVSPIPGMLARIAAAFGITELLALVPAISALVSINPALREQLQVAFKAKRSDIWARAMPYVSGLFYHMARNWAPAIQELPNPVVAVQAAVLGALTETEPDESTPWADIAPLPLAPTAPAPAMGSIRAHDPSVAGSGLPVGPGIAHVPSGPDIFSRPRSERLAYMGAAQRVMAEPQVDARPILSAGNMVAGANLDAEGVILGWYGAGELALSTIKEKLALAGCPDTWAPSPKSCVAHVGFALAPLTNGGNVVRSDRGGRKKGDRVASTDGRVRKFAGRWIVLTPATRGDVGDHAGRINLTAVLFTDGRLELTGPTDVCERVNADYVRRVAEERFPAAEVTMWLRDTLIRRFGAISMGPAGWYVPNRHVAGAERLCDAMSQAWGSGWILPGLPITTGERLFSGIVRGLASEVATVLTDLEASEAQAKKQGQSQLGARGAATFMRRLREVNDRAKGYATVLGASHVATIRAELTKALARVEPLCDDTAERFAMLDMD